MRSADGTIVDVSFAYPEKWTVSKGPNLDVRDVTTSDSAFVLVAPLPRGKKTAADLPAAFFTTLLFAPDGKYGAYGSVDDFKTSNVEVVELTNPRGATQVQPATARPSSSPPASESPLARQRSQLAGV